VLGLGLSGSIGGEGEGGGGRDKNVFAGRANVPARVFFRSDH